ncbi:MAG: class I SAM-dependent methyltransferase [Proteobacteria bacterium]|nr:class I SAM-dependent methyltransferase [Pseudomonadota bacterium]
MEDNECYLEIGTYKGLTLLSAAYGNVDRTCIGCDKFRFLGRFTGSGILAKRALRRSLERYRAHTGKIEFHEMSSERMFSERRVSTPVGVYFYDGDHSFEGTYRGIIQAFPLLSHRSIIVVDDWNDIVIRGATREALRDTKLHCLWERELPGDHTVDSWWNGLGVFFVEKQDRS